MKNKNVDDEEVISNDNFVKSGNDMKELQQQQQQQSSPPMHHHERDTTPSPTITMIRSRRNNNNNSNTGGESPGYAEDSSPGGNRFCNLKKKRFRDNIGGIDYEPVETGERGGGGVNTDDNIVLLSSTTTSTATTTTMGGGRGSAAAIGCGKVRRFCHNTSRQVLRTTVSIMNFVARILLWGSFIATIVGVVWYSHELKSNGTDSHLIAWFSAGAFVILGFPISMCGIIMHLKNYYQPNVQCYVVRILWMVPIYSISSWLCLRFFTYAIYMETLRDFYESYVLYSFFQYLIEVLGGEETLVLMLKDKSPTRGAHIWGLGLCMTPWAMGQPTSIGSGGHSVTTSPKRPMKRGVRWTSPFFVRCKFGVLQYVVLKFFSAIFVMLLERYGLYKEGDFTPRGGYLYIAILTNLSQCWALYCLVFFYYALKNELGPIRPVGKFVSVKALVFFTWWQSLGISILFQMDMIPHYTSLTNGREWSSEAVAKGMQDWLICIEMFIAAIVHTFVFPHTDYLEPLGILQRSGSMRMIGTRRLGRKGRGHIYRRHDDNKSAGSNSSAGSADLELGSGGYSSLAYQTGEVNAGDCDTIEESDHMENEANIMSDSRQRLTVNPKHERQGFVRALLDSTLLPRDVIDESVGIFKGEFNVEKKTLLQHAATSDEYDLFSRSSKRQKSNRRTQKK